jgi:hypothetical protein
MAWIVRFVAAGEPERVLLEEVVQAPPAFQRGQKLRLARSGQAEDHEVVGLGLLLDLDGRNLVQVVRLARRPKSLTSRVTDAYDRLGEDSQVVIASLVLTLVGVALATVAVTWANDRPLFLAWLGWLARPVVGWSLFLGGMSLVAVVGVRARSAPAQRLLGIGLSVLTLVLVLVWLELSRPPQPSVAWPADHAAYWRWLRDQATLVWLPVVAPGLGWLALVTGLLGWSAVEKLLGRLAR